MVVVAAVEGADNLLSVPTDGDGPYLDTRDDDTTRYRRVGCG